MNAINRLKRDDQIIRSELDVLETALGMGPDAWYVLREVCFTLARQLRDHMRREEELIAAYHRTQGVEPGLSGLSTEHHDEPEHLRTINRLFVSEPHHTLVRIAPALRGVISGLRHHMAKEEAELFPVLEQVLSGPTSGDAAPPVPFQRVHEAMTVNYMVHQFPVTRPVFERLFINVPYEGCSCLDEVAWRHGIESSDLLQMLEQAIALSGCACQNPPAGDEWSSETVPADDSKVGCNA